MNCRLMMSYYVIQEETCITGVTVYEWMMVLDGEQETEPELNLPGKYKETNTTSKPCLDVFSFFPG